MGLVTVTCVNTKPLKNITKAVITKDPEAFVNDQFYLGQMQKRTARYEDAP